METVDTNPSHAVSPAALAALLGQPDTPLILDVRRPERFAQSLYRLPLSQHVAPDALAGWMRHRTPQAVVLYCVYGHEVSQNAAARLRAAGWDARYLLGGIEGGEPGVDDPGLLTSWQATPAPRLRQRPDLGVTGVGRSRWITRERPKIDRIACPWLIRRFIDPKARFLFVAPSAVTSVAEATGAAPFDIEGATFSHRGEDCTFDTLIAEFGLRLPALDRLATIGGEDAPTGNDVTELTIHDVPAKHAGAAVPDPDRGTRSLQRDVLAQARLRHYLTDRQLGRGRLPHVRVLGILDYGWFDGHFHRS